MGAIGRRGCAEQWAGSDFAPVDNDDRIMRPCVRGGPERIPASSAERSRARSLCLASFVAFSARCLELVLLISVFSGFQRL